MVVRARGGRSAARGTRHAVQMVDVFGELERMLSETMPRNITIHFAPVLDPWSTTGDPTQLQQVLLNLCLTSSPP